MRSPIPVLVLALVLLCTSPALAISTPAPGGDGMHVDPDSAPAVEYALPLETARRASQASSDDSRENAVGANAGGRGGAAPPPAFGGGISPKPPLAAEGRSPRRAQARPRVRRSAPAGTGHTPEEASASTITGASGAPILYSLGGALGVLAAGALGAATLRRRHPAA